MKLSVFTLTALFALLFSFIELRSQIFTGDEIDFRGDENIIGGRYEKKTKNFSNDIFGDGFTAVKKILQKSDLQIKLKAEKPVWMGTNVMWQKGRTRSRLYIIRGEYLLSETTSGYHFIKFKIGAGKLGLGVETSKLGGVYLKSFAPAIELKFGSEFNWPCENIKINYQIGYRYLSFKNKTLKHIQPNNVLSDRHFTEMYSADIDNIKYKLNDINSRYTGLVLDFEMKIML